MNPSFDLPIKLRHVALAYALLTTSPSSEGASATILIHGAQYAGAFQGVPKWETEMANAAAIRVRQMNGGKVPAIYVMNLGASRQFRLEVASGPKPSDSGDVIVKVDWSDFSAPYPPFNDMAAAIGKALAARLLSPPDDGSFSGSFTTLPLHFIGHSRGAYVASSAIRELGRKGIWIDSATFLDPQEFHVPFPLNPLGFINGEGDLRIWNNIKFADNYFQQVAIAPVPAGFPLSGALNFNLTSLFPRDIARFQHTAHELVHTYYHGTIDLTATNVDEQTIRRTAWYGVESGLQPTTGFYYTPTVGNEFSKIDYLQGLGEPFGGEADRSEFIAPDDSPQWPNVIIQNRINNWTNRAGLTVQIQLLFNGIGSVAGIEMVTDNDLNPFNTGRTIIANPTFQPAENLFLWKPELSDSGKYLAARIVAPNGFVRHYYLQQPFTILTALAPEVPPPTVGLDLAVTGNRRWNDRSRGDGDGIPEGGEAGGLQLELRNAGTSTLRYVKATLIGPSTGPVTIDDGTLVYGDMQSGAAAWGLSSFLLNIAGISFQTEFPFALRVVYVKENVEYQQSFTGVIPIYPPGHLAPKFVVDSGVWHDSIGNGDADGVLESGEAGPFDVLLKNVGTAPATRVRVRLESAPSFIQLRGNTVEYPDLPPGGTPQKGRGTATFHFDNPVPRNFAGIAKANVVITYGTDDKTVTIPDQPIFDVKPAPWLAVHPPLHDFGITSPQSNVVVAARIDNQGSTAMVVSNITSSHTDTRWPGDVLPWSIPPGDSKFLQVSINPAGLLGEIQREIRVISDGRFYSNPDRQPDRIMIKGLVSESPPSAEIPISNAGNLIDVDVNQNLIVWADSRNGNNDIYGYDLAKGQEFRITSNAQDQRKPRISGNLVVWEDLRNWNGQGEASKDIYGFNLLTRQEFAVATTPSSEKLAGVDGNRIAFTLVYAETTTPNNHHVGRNLYVFDASTGVTTPITAYSVNNGNLTGSVEAPDYPVLFDFSNGTLAWCELNYVLRGTELQSSDKRVMKLSFDVDAAPVRVFSGSTIGLSANGPRVVWATDSPNLSDSQIFLWENGLIRQLTTESREHADLALALGRNFVVYNTTGRSGLFYFDLIAGIEQRLTERPASEWTRADENAAVWISTNRIFLTFPHQADLAIAAGDISFSNDFPPAGDPIEVTVVVHNLSKVAVTNNITVGIYGGDPDLGGKPLGREQQISGGVPAFGQYSIQFRDVIIEAAGTHNIYARLSSAVEDNPANNQAFRPLPIAPRPVPDVSLAILAGSAEEDSNTATIMVIRSHETNNSLMVSYSVSGTATPGVDYRPLSGSVVIPAGAFSAPLDVVPLPDNLSEGDETVVLSLSSSPNYEIKSSASISVTVKDNDFPPTVTIARSDGNGVISWDGTGGTLEAADVITGPWTPVAGASSPHTVAVTSETTRFYRVRR